MTEITIMQRFGRASLVAMAGGAVAWAIMGADAMFHTDYGFLRAAIMGAFLAGLIVARGFGGQGNWGWYCSGLSFALATVLGAVFAVPLLFLDEVLMEMELIRTLSEFTGVTLLGPLYVVSTIGGKLLVLKAWMAVFILIHLLVIGGNTRRRS